MQLYCDRAIILTSDLRFKHLGDGDGARFSINHAGIFECVFTSFDFTLGFILVDESDLLRVSHLNAALRRDRIDGCENNSVNCHITWLKRILINLIDFKVLRLSVGYDCVAGKRAHYKTISIQEVNI